jgi:hypothetical protein
LGCLAQVNRDFARISGPIRDEPAAGNTALETRELFPRYPGIHGINRDNQAVKQ